MNSYDKPVYPSAFGDGVYEPYDELSAEVMANNAAIVAKLDAIQRRNRRPRRRLITPGRVVSAVIGLLGAAVLVGAVWVNGGCPWA